MSQSGIPGGGLALQQQNSSSFERPQTDMAQMRGQDNRSGADKKFDETQGGMHGGKGMSQAQMSVMVNQNNARRFSIYLKNVPHDKLDMASISEYFKKQFGDIQSIRLFEEKRACSIKFKAIESAEKAATFAQTSPIWDEPTIRLIYNVGGVPVVGGGTHHQQS